MHLYYDQPPSHDDEIKHGTSNFDDPSRVPIYREDGILGQDGVMVKLIVEAFL